MTGAHLVRQNRSETKSDSVIKAFLAWIGACYVSAFAIILLVGISQTVASMNFTDLLQLAAAALVFSLFVGMYVVFFTAPFWPVLVWVAKLARLKRGFADLVLGALMGGGLIGVMMLPQLNDGEGILLVFMAAGAVGGLTYWWLAGKPN